MRRIGIIVATLGVLLLAFAAVLRFAIVPAQKQLPSDTNKVRHYAGTATTLLNAQAVTSGNLGTLFLHNVPLTIDRAVKVTDTSGQKAVVTELRTVKSADGTQLSRTTYTYAVDRKSLEPVAAFGAKTVTTVPGRALTISWPFGTTKQDYTAYVVDTQGGVAAKYSGQAKVDGLNTYVFKVDLPATRITDAQTLTGYPQALPRSLLSVLPKALGLPAAQATALGRLLQAMPDPVPITYLYSGQTTLWVAPDTGTIVKTTKAETRQAVLTVPGQSAPVPLTTVAQLTYTQTPASVSQAVNDAKDATSAITLYGTTLPLIGLIVGVGLTGAGLYLILRRRPPAAMVHPRHEQITPELSR
ncbi:MAG TPA: DUF3068 domain-containing protein [Jatrophihabitans sp.]|jgi:hypothetical protein|uniref:DUF3068 domain-containing protein n=1 Tax=Jatrophihabitans sp. TaxID=1932789 RepID=UPI002E099678|nr:DUF3068 domain-containing protein [Jatrophihabitans sp.]